MKKFLWSLSIVALVGLVNCGGGSSKEAKELLQKILQFVGIPQTIIVNVCQDSNRDGMCNIGEIQAKVTINKGDSVDDIWRKIALNSEGQYFLETYNPEFPILLELLVNNEKFAILHYSFFTLHFSLKKSGFLRPNPLTIKHNPKTQNIVISSLFHQ